MHTVAEILRPEFARSWHEAVAIVQAAAALLVPGVNLPGPSDLYLDDDGTLAFGFGSESSAEPVTALAGLLEDLLEGVDAPASLRELAVENARSASHATAASFSQALAFFERPNRTSDLRAVATRLSGFRPNATSSLDQEFARLRDKVAAADPGKEENAKEKPARQRRLTKRQQAVAIALLAFVVFGSLAVSSGAHRGLGSAVGKAEDGIQHVVSLALNQFGLSTTPSAAPATGPVEKPSPPANASNTPAPSKVAEKPTDRSVRATATNGRTVPAGQRERPRPPEDLLQPPSPVGKVIVPPSGPPAMADASRPAASPVPPPAVARDSVGAPSPAVATGPDIFSSEDEQVQAPLLVRPQMPREPAPASDTGYFELIVDENGDVSQVKLISPRRKYYDRMLVSAAKAWKFRPALLNGRPVKYRLHVPIIMAAMPGR